MSSRITIRKLDSSLSISDVLARFQNERFLILLESAGRIRRRDARFSILTADPVDFLRVNSVGYGQNPFHTLRSWQIRLPDERCELPFCGGIAGLMSYELGGAFEVVPRPLGDRFATPALFAGLYDWSIVWDHLEQAVFLAVSQIGGTDDRSELSDVRSRIDWVMQRLSVSATDDGRQQASIGVQPDTFPVMSPKMAAQNTVSSVTNDGRPGNMPTPTPLHGYPLPGHPDVWSDFSNRGYISAVQQVIEYIRAGDIFQANLSQKLTAAWQGSAADLYRRVRTRNPAPFCGLLQLDDCAVVSASPERFLKVTDGAFVETRPIKGTRRRHRSPIADLFTGSELAASEKDRAENVMIVDLQRNDISRVCRTGSVKVTGLCEVEVFETVQHLVSTIVGQLRSDCDVWDLCAASVPGGSITGAPKIRAMEIIAELEPTVRGAYCGNLFYLGANGCFDSSILIRTFTLKDGIVQFPVGGGIVADSNPEDEYAETLHKAAGMLNTLRTD